MSEGVGDSSMFFGTTSFRFAKNFVLVGHEVPQRFFEQSFFFSLKAV